MRPGDRFDVAPEDVDAIMKCVDYWEGKSLYEALRRSLPQEINEAWDANVIDDTWVSGAGLGNEVVDYDLVVTKGLEDVMRPHSRPPGGLHPRSPAISARSGSCRQPCRATKPLSISPTASLQNAPIGGGLPGRQA